MPSLIPCQHAKTSFLSRNVTPHQALTFLGMESSCAHAARYARQVHGFGAFGEQFRGQVQALARAGLHVRSPAFAIMALSRVPYLTLPYASGMIRAVITGSRGGALIVLGFSLWGHVRCCVQ